MKSPLRCATFAGLPHLADRDGQHTKGSVRTRQGGPVPVLSDVSVGRNAEIAASAAAEPAAASASAPAAVGVSGTAPL